MAKLHLPYVTLLAVDCVDPDLAQKALLYSLRNIDFADVILLSDKPPKQLHLSVRYGATRRMTLDGYNRFMLRDLHAYVNTPHVLTVQSDGFVLDAQKWQDEFMAYDYIGAPWPKASWNHGQFVGNSGFCLRSKRLLEATSRIPEEVLDAHARVWHHAVDDIFTCVDARSYLPSMQFAPPELAWEFSQEQPMRLGFDLSKSFGFHGMMTEETKSLSTMLQYYYH